MTRRLTLLTIALLAVAASCSSGASSGTGGADTTAAAVAGDATTTVAGDVTTTVAAPTTTVDPGAPTTPAPTAVPATPAPTAAPTTVACRPVGDLTSLDAAAVNVRRGDCGEGVRQVQDWLNFRLGIALVSDGRFGPGTETAVRNYQASVGLPVDGIVGEWTWIALTNDDYDPAEA